MWKLAENKDWSLLEQEFDWVRDMKGVLQDKVHHAEGDVAIHTCMVLGALEQMEEYQELPVQDQNMLWASALLHDVEKRSTTVMEADRSITSKGHAKKGALTARNISLQGSSDTVFDKGTSQCAGSFSRAAIMGTGKTRPYQSCYRSKPAGKYKAAGNISPCRCTGKDLP